MLQKEAVPRKTFQLLERLMKDENLCKFSLAGGTALALYMGHRVSIDLDLFQQEEFDATQLEDYLIRNYNFVSNYKEKNTLKGTIDGVKIDCITSSSKLCKPIREEENIRLYSPEDICAMKLLAILDNGTRLKDFVDVAYLSSRYSLGEMVVFATQKYPNKNPVMFEKGILFQEDIIHEDIALMQGDYSWDIIAGRLEDMVNYKNQIFDDYPTRQRGVGRRR